MQFSQHSLCDKIIILYLRVSGFRDDITLSWVVYFRFQFSLYSPIHHFLANISALILLCCLYVYVANPLLVLLFLTLIINISTINSWASPMETFAIALLNSCIPKSYLKWIIGGAHGTLLSKILMYRWTFELVLYSSSIEDISNKLFDGSQSIHLIGEYFDIHGARCQ